jgi:hypothetical protein
MVLGSLAKTFVEWCGLEIHTARSRFFFLGHLSHQCICGERESGDQSAFCSAVRVLFGRIDAASLQQALVFAGSYVEPFIPAAFLDYLDDQSAFLASVVGELPCREC